MKFTKEELETVGKFIDEYIYYSPPISLSDYLDQCKKPERKKIVVEIEYEVSTDAIPLSANNLQTHFEIATELKNPKVTELPEVFSKGDMVDFANYNSDYPEFLTMNNLSRFLSERNK